MENFGRILDRMRVSGMTVPAQTVQIKTENAKVILRNAFDCFLALENRKTIWIDSYSEVAKWLENNEGKGLLLYGDCGQGKSLLSRFILPAILLQYHNKVVTSFDVQEMNTRLDAVLMKKIVSLDDIGTEAMINDFGNKRMAFAEIVDQAEKKGKLLIISTNLNKDKLIEMYGERVFDRLCKLTKRILFTGKSMR